MSASCRVGTAHHFVDLPRGHCPTLPATRPGHIPGFADDKAKPARPTPMPPSRSRT